MPNNPDKIMQAKTWVSYLCSIHPWDNRSPVSLTLPPSWLCWNTSLRRCPGGILSRCPNHLNWRLSMQYSSRSTPSPSLELLHLGQRIISYLEWASSSQPLYTKLPPSPVIVEYHRPMVPSGSQHLQNSSILTSPDCLLIGQTDEDIVNAINTLSWNMKLLS